MCKTLREQTLKNISINNTKIIDCIIKYINNLLNIDLYKESNYIKCSEDIKKIKSFYKQTIKRLLNIIERHSMKERLLLEDVKKGQELLNIKKSQTVKSPTISDGIFAQMPGNSQEKILISIGEEIEKQNQRIKKYDDFVTAFEKEKCIIQDFIELSPYTVGVEVLIRHFIEGQSYKDIAIKMNYEEIYYAWKRAAADLSMILMFAL